jgi:hypothetical protein
MILPSILEYEQAAIEAKLEALKQVPFELIGGPLQLHIDIILPDFASERSVRSSWDPISTCILAMELGIPPTIHIMGDIEETKDIMYELEHSIIPAQSMIFTAVGSEFETRFQHGWWYNLEQWDEDMLPTKHSLLMTVHAGKSGQVADPDKKQAAINVARNSRFVTILDGGWTIEENQLDLNLVSYGSFWRALDKAKA